ncbi:hypothetical protein ECE50_005240 [Chitinophaga sp. Mgbs1]|uniref:Erythromycin biosynthesis protein CIII-like C-terminal domain-containing protein n=1 Tax=Chitinophaga solisilvae TaxID=1233460 RepID=A0A433WPE7_9BACT|nr:hypothetical protein [Chitinophaga solisilvae]
MSRFLFGSVPLHGHLNPTIGIAQQLIRDHHTVAYAAHSHVKQVFEKAGIPFLEKFQWGDAVILSNETIAAGKKLLLPWILKKKMNTTPAECIIHQLEQGVTDFLELIDNWRPDVCVFDTMFYPGIIAAEIRKVPYAVSCPTQLLLPCNTIIPEEKGHTMRPFRKLLAQLMVLTLRRITQQVNKIRQLHQLPLQQVFWKHHTPALYLAYTSDAFEFRRSDLLSQTYYIGPSVSREFAGADVPFPWEWLDGRPVVYFSMGTVYIRKQIISQVIKASAGAPWQLVISTGKAFPPETWTDIPENVLIRSYVPQVALMEKVSAVVSSGGFGTVGQALMNGVPLVVIPQILEHRVTASKVVHAKAGIKLSSWLVSAGRLHKAIAALLQDPSYRQHASEIRADYQQCNAPVSGARLLEHLAKKRKSLHRPPHQGPTLYSRYVQELLNSI